MSKPEPGTDSWLEQVQEDIIEPDRPIIDPHHHLWMKRFGRDYLLEQLWRDTGSGHNVVKTLFVECSAFYLREGPEYLRPTGETIYISELAIASAEGESQATIAGIIAHADLTLDKAKLDELLEKHTNICAGRFRGIRHAGARDNRPEDLLIPGKAPANLYSKEPFRAGLRSLAARNLTYDTWHYHHQNLDFINLAQAVPECTLILDHFGTPLGVGTYRKRRDEIFQEWKTEMRQLAKCANVYVKLGGMAMPDNGFGWHTAARPPSSDEFVAAQKKYYLRMIECFGAERCMFESNFPVDRLSISYPVLWNAFKKLTARFSADEKQALFYGTAERVYSLTD